jgi:predicted ArsR family transcriptional regulator
MARPQDIAPKGFVTVREAAQVLGISEQAIRARMDRKTLPENVVVQNNGESRRYIPREALDEALRRTHELATRDDTAELTLADAMLVHEATEELINEIRRHEAAVNRGMKEAGNAMVAKLDAIAGRLERDSAERREIIELVRQMAEYEKKRQERMAEYRNIAYALLVGTF